MLLRRISLVAPSPLLENLVCSQHGPNHESMLQRMQPATTVKSFQLGARGLLSSRLTGGGP